MFVSSRSGKVMSEGSKLVKIAGYEDLRQDLQQDLRQDLRQDLQQDLRQDLRQDLHQDLRCSMIN